MSFLIMIGGLFGAKGKIAAGIGAGLLLLVVGGGLFGLKSCYDRSVVTHALDAGNVRVLKQEQKADTQAADQRVSDTQTIQQQREELRHEAEQASNPTDLRRRRGCAILRQQGRDTASIAACRGLAPGS